MNQNSYQAITAMINAFPQSAVNLKALLLTFEQVLSGVSDQSITETATRFCSGLVEGQSRTFAPSVAEFSTEARRWDGLMPYRNRAALPKPSRDPWTPQPKENRVRMGFKMSVLSAGISLGQVERVAEANNRGLDDMIALGQLWGVPVPEELWQQIEAA